MKKSLTHRRFTAASACSDNQWKEVKFNFILESIESSKILKLLLDQPLELSRLPKQQVLELTKAIGAARLKGVDLRE